MLLEPEREMPVFELEVPLELEIMLLELVIKRIPGLVFEIPFEFVIVLKLELEKK